jgi:preprotein translocase subunit SecG
MQTFLTILYVLVCFFLIMVVLLQSGKGGGMGSAFGGTSQTVFGGAGAGNILTKLTAVGAASFMILSATMAYLSSSSESALERAQQDMEAREAARSGALLGDGDDAPEPADPAEMSIPEAQADDDGDDADGEPEEAADGPADDDGLGDPPPPEEPDTGGDAPEPEVDGLDEVPDGL